MNFPHIKYILLSISLLLVWGCDKKPNFTMNLGHFFDIDKNITYLYKMVDTHEVNGKKEPFMPERYMESKVIPLGNNCINIQSYVLLEPKDAEHMDPRLETSLKDNKLRTMDEKYCVEGNTIKINGEVMVDLKNKWKIQAESQSQDGSKLEENTIECQVVDITEKVLLEKRRKIIHTQCSGEPLGKVESFYAEKIGLYKLVVESEFPEFHSKSKNEIILMKEVKK